jgi:hypothetical protein
MSGTRIELVLNSSASTGGKLIAFVSSSEAATEEEVTHPIGRDRGKTTTRKGKENEASSSQSMSFFSIGGVISTLKKLATSFTRAQM